MTRHTLVRKTAIAFVVLIQSLFLSASFLPKMVLADACPTVTGTTSPTGSAEATFTYNPATCLWENNYYTWDPVTKAYTPKYDTTPVYNPLTDTWDVTHWDYSPAAGKYLSSIVSTPAHLKPDPSTISNTGTGSNNSINSTNNNNTSLTSDQVASINNFLTSLATSGGVNANNNTTVGNVSSGNANAIATLINLLGSSWDTKDLILFTANIGNYVGDLLFDPSSILNNTGTNSSNAINSNNNNNVTVNNSANNAINNNINMGSTSGDVNANGNTTVGNVSSGNANTQLDLFNLINSAIGAGQTFLGSINIYGTFNGDILLPFGTAQNLIGSTGTGSSNAINQNNTNNTNITNNMNNSINNNLGLNATSGSVDASGNTTTGDVSSGQANTTTNEFDQIGRNISSNNGLLVFVNVLGKWTGLLFNIPEGSSILGTGSNSTNTINSNNTNNLTVNNNENNAINNNANLSAVSGNVSAAGNTHVGNVKSGDASVTANIFNSIGSSLNFSNWFGVLFINVFGNWDGSFGVNTAAGGQGGGSPNSAQSSSPTAQGSTSVLGVVTHGATASYLSSLSNQITGGSSGSNASPTGTSSTSTNKPLPAVTSPVAIKKGQSPWGYIILIGIVAALLIGSRLRLND